MTDSFNMSNVHGYNHESWVGLSGGFTPCRHLRPSSGREHTIVTYSGKVVVHSSVFPAPIVRSRLPSYGETLRSKCASGSHP